MRARDVGKLSGAEMDNKWNITHVYVDLSKEASNELGLRKPILGHITILLKIHMIDVLGEVIKLNKTREELRGIPEYSSS